MHSWQKSYANPPIPNRPSALSWMNYPWNYPGGANAFWNGFPFQFDDPEIIHVRHGFRNNVIMGGNPFATGAAVEDPQAFSNPVEDKSGLKLELRAKSSFSLGEPVVVEIKLSTTDLNGIRVSKNLHPNTGSVGIGIQNPGGQVVAYEPMIEHCVAGNFTTLNAENPSIYDSAFLSYGKGGMYFNQIGTYKIRAVYPALDGSMVLSNVLSIRVKSPHSSSDEDVADLFLGDQQGTILYLLGSDSEFLDQGNKALGRVITEFGDHPLSVYAKLVKGFNAGRTFKTLTPDKTITVRPAQYNESINMLSDVIDASEKNMGVDNITLSTTMLRMANVQRSSGDAKSAKETAEHMVDFFSKKGLKSHIMKLIESQAKELTKKK
jgi:hypothetical protein